MLAAIAICILLFIAWLCLTEFSYVPLSANKWVYQVFAKEYEAKWNSTAYSDMDFQQPIIDALRPALEGNNERILVDLACGTGRMSRLVLAQEWFSGQVIAIDQSREMLHVLERETQNWPVELRSRLKVLCSNLDGRFTMPSCDAIAFMEAGELIPNFPFVLTQIARSLTSGGILVTTRPPSLIGFWFFGRGQTRNAFSKLLCSLDFVQVHEMPWRWRYKIVIAKKRHVNSPSLAALAEAVT